MELTFPKAIEANIDPHLRNLLKKMLEKSPQNRIDMSQIIIHDWITEASHLRSLPYRLAYI